MAGPDGILEHKTEAVADPDRICRFGCGFFTLADTVCTHLDIVFGAGGYCPEVLIDGVNAGSNEWDGSGMEHLELVRSRPTRNGSETYYKTWTLIPKGSRE